MGRILFAHSAWLVPLGLLAVVGTVWLRRWVSAHAVRAVYNPPVGFSPIEAGVVVDGRFDTQDVVAGIVQLAVRGIVGLERMANGDVLMSIKRAWQNEPGLRTADIAILARIYAHGDSVRPLSEFKGDTKDLEDIFDTLAQTLTEKGMFSAPPSAVRRLGRWGAVVVSAAWIQISWSFGLASLSSAGAALVTGLILWSLAGWYPQRFLSPTGQRARRELLGFREFLHRAERDRLDRMPPDTLHKLLPWAIALGVTDAWLGQFSGRNVAPTEWYTGPKPVGVAELGGELKQLQTQYSGKQLARPLVGRLVGRNEQHAVERQDVPRGLGEQQMPQMDRVKRATEQSKPHLHIGSGLGAGGWGLWATALSPEP